MIGSARIGLASLACLSLTPFTAAQAPERKFLPRFDADRDGRLEGEELDAARNALRREVPASAPGNRGPADPDGRGGPEWPRFSAGRDVDPMTLTSHWDKALYHPDVVRTLSLDLPYDDWIGDLELFRNSDVELPTQMLFDEEKFETVGLVYRDEPGFPRVPRLGKRSFRVSIDFAEPGRDVKGYRTLELLNALGDPSMMATVLGAHLAAKHLPAPKANFIEVLINAESWGVFTSVESFNKDFVASRWPQFRGAGARWTATGSPPGAGLDFRGEDLSAYRDLYRLDGEATEAEWEALRELCRTLSQTPIDQLEAKIRPILDVDAVLWFLALDIGLVHRDGYWAKAGGYALYRDPNGMFHVIPQDLGAAFPVRADGVAGSAVELDPFHGLDDPGKPLRSRLLQVPAFRERYIANLKTLAGELAWEELGPVVARNRELIGELARLDTRKLVTTEAFERATSPEPPASPDEPSLRSFCERRSRFLREWNPDAPPKPTPNPTPNP